MKPDDKLWNIYLSDANEVTTAAITLTEFQLQNSGVQNAGNTIPEVSSTSLTSHSEVKSLMICS